MLSARAPLFVLEAHLLHENNPRSSLMCTFVGSLPLDSKVVIHAQVSCPLLAWRHLPPGMVSGMSRHPRPEHPGQTTTRVLPGWRGGEPSTKGPPTSVRTAQRLQLEPPPGGSLPAGFLSLCSGKRAHSWGLLQPRGLGLRPRRRRMDVRPVRAKD